MMNFHRLFLAIATLVVGTVVVVGFLVVGSPGTRRLEQLDERRLEDLRQIHRQIQSLVRKSETSKALQRPLPKSLDEVAKLARHEKLNLTDPETGERYGYVVKDEKTYQLCATFSLPRDAGTDIFWNHAAGRQCFTINALDPP